MARDWLDLDPLAAFLTSDRAPDGCMDLSELDGFLAGLVAGPGPISPATFLPVVWDDEEPAFAGTEEAARVLMLIEGRFREIAAGLEQDPADYAPVYWQDVAGTVILEDWAAGFMQAVSLAPDAWRAALADPDGSALLIPIAALAGLAMPDQPLAELAIPDDMLDRIIARAEDIIPDCVIGLRAFWRQRGVAMAGWESGPSTLRH